jgi:hyperosmotically inducible periplasmic protein
MTKNTIISSVAGMALALTAVACGETARNDNSPANRNVAVVTNANNANTRAATNDNRGRDVTREDFDREKDRFSKEAKDSGRKIGTGANDLWIWVKTRAALAAADDLRDSTVNVDVENDTVTLTGTVANAAQKSRAETVAKGIEGVKAVKNQVTVKAETKVGEDDDKSDTTKKPSKS